MKSSHIWDLYKYLHDKKLYPRVFKQLVEGIKIKKWDGKEEKEENNCQGPKLSSYNGPNQAPAGASNRLYRPGKVI